MFFMAIFEFMLGRADSSCLQLFERSRWKIKSSNTMEARVSPDMAVHFGAYVMKSEDVVNHLHRCYIVMLHNFTTSL